MKPLLTAAILAVATLVLGAMLALTCGEPSSVSPPFNIPSTDQSFVFSKPTPIDLDKLPAPPPPLQPGVYQTYPWTIIIVVPGRGIDDRIFAETPDANSKMPIINIKPHVEVVPLPQTKPQPFRKFPPRQ